MNRRKFLKTLAVSSVLAGCGKDLIVPGETPRNMRAPEVILYDCYAMALYMDGGLGPKTGIIKVDYLLKNEPVTLEFWHGHGGKNHKFVLTPDLYAQMKQLKKVYVTTDSVAGHTHKLFIDFSDPKWRVPGAQPVPVPT